MDETPRNTEELAHAVGRSATAAIAAGYPIAAVADAEQVGLARARRELGSDLLKRVERAARRRREAETEYAQAAARAARLGLAHRDIAAAAHIAHGTIRAILTRTNHPNGNAAEPGSPQQGTSVDLNRTSDRHHPRWSTPIHRLIQR